MNNKKLGTIILIISIIIGILLITFINGLSAQAEALGCYQNLDCEVMNTNLNITHLATGIMGAILALGFYLIFFAKEQQELLQSLQQHKKQRTKEEEFNLISKALSNDEKAILKIIKQQEGITQNTLRIKANTSKAKLSYLLKDLEQKNLIKKKKKGKTQAIYSR